MLYGSSPYLIKKLLGVTGPTGATGITGAVGNPGPVGQIGPTGNTGPSITGMTLSPSGNVITTFDDGQVFVSSTGLISGSDGDYYVFVDGENVVAGAMDVFSGLSFESTPGTNNLDYSVPTLRLRGLTTASRNGATNIITINTSPNGENINVNYSLQNISYLGICAGSEGQLVVKSTLPGFFDGLTGTRYDSQTETVNLQTSNYGERVHFVNAVRKEIPSTSQDYFYWSIDWEKANTFVLNSYQEQKIEGRQVIAQIVLVKTPTNTNFAKAVTIIVPSGITSTNSTVTKFATAEDVSGFTLDNNTDYSVSWPLTYAPCFSEGTDVINAVHFDGIWYANYGVYSGNTGNESITWNSSYTNCPGSYNDTDPIYIPPPEDPMGLCCVGCSAGSSFVTVQSGCQNLMNAGDAYFFPGIMTTSYPGCTGANAPNGICCYKNPIGNIVKHPQLVRACDCLRIAKNANSTPWSHWQIINNCYKNINAIDCSRAFNRTGACCDGFGDCQDEVTSENCAVQQKFWQGPGTVCTYYTPGSDFPVPIEICRGFAGATSGCCTLGECVDMQYQSGCTLGQYFGCGYTCGSFECVYDPPGGGGGEGGGGTNATCPQCFSGNSDIFRLKKYDPTGTTLTGFQRQLRVGDFFAGGIVAGVFKPKGTTCLGNAEAFSGLYNGLPIESYSFDELVRPEYGLAEGIFNALNDGTEKTASYYKSVYDPMGYGFTLPANHGGECDSWLLIVMPWPVRIDQRYTVRLSDGNNGWKPYEFKTFAQLDNTVKSDTSTTPYTSLQVQGQYSPGLDRKHRTRTVNTFAWSHGGTAFCWTLPSDLAYPLANGGVSAGGWATIEPGAEICNASVHGGWTLGGAVSTDGFYGTLPLTRYNVEGSTYWGNATTFNTCPLDDLLCETANCASTPCLRSSLAKPGYHTSSTGYWSRSWGIRNCTSLFYSDFAEYFYYIGSDFPGGDLAEHYGAGPGFTATFFHSGTQNAKTTMSEGCSVYNRQYYTTEYMKASGYPQVSRWYVPSIDELAFIAKQCAESGVNLQQKLYEYPNSIGDNGIPIGSSVLGANGYVWSSTGTFDEGVTRQYIQATGGAPCPNNQAHPDGYLDPYQEFPGLYAKDVNAERHPNQFTKAWAMKFPEWNPLTQEPSSPNEFKVRKSHDFNDKHEVRLVRLIRCDQRFLNYQENTSEICVNRMWNIPRLTDAAICNGTSQPRLGGTVNFTVPPGSWTPDFAIPSIGRYTRSNYYGDPQVLTIIKNGITGQ